MPAEPTRATTVPGGTWEAALGGEEGVFNVAEYVLSLSDRRHNENAAAKGKEKFQQLCVGCHGAEGTGNQALGAPNLTDRIWLYGGSQKTVMESIAKGRQGRMPAHEEFLGPTAVFFTLFDPAELFAGTATFEVNRLGAYSSGFFLFWLMTATSSALTTYFMRPPETVNPVRPPDSRTT